MQTKPAIWRPASIIITISVLYVLFARASLMIPLPPGNGIAPGLPAALGLAAGLGFGWLAGVAVFMGALVFHSDLFLGSQPFFIAAGLAAGAGLQSWAGQALIHRFAGPFPLRSLWSTLLGTGFTMISALIGPAIGWLALSSGQSTLTADGVFVMFEWWIRDAIACLLLSPLVFTLYKRSTNQQILQEPTLWPLTSILIGVTLFTFNSIRNFEQAQQRAQLGRDVSEIAAALTYTNYVQSQQSINAIHALYQASTEVTRSEFKAFTTPLLETFATNSSLAWAAAVPQTRRTQFELSLRAEGFSTFSIIEPDAEGKNIRAGPRAEYFPITYIEPFAENAALLGFDYAAHPACLEAILLARDSGLPVASAPLQTMQADDSAIGYMIFTAVYRNQTTSSSVEERRANLVGIISVVSHMEDLVRTALATIPPSDLRLYLFDIKLPDQPQYLGGYSANNQSLPSLTTDTPTPDDFQDGNSESATLSVAGRDWLMVAVPGPDFASADRGWASWVSLLIGCVLTAGFLAFVHGQQEAKARVVRSEREYRDLADFALTGVGSFSLSGAVIYANAALARMFGFSTAAEMIGKDIHSQFIPASMFEHIVSMLQASGQVSDQEVDIVTTHGENRHLLYSASLHESQIRATLVDITDRVRAGREFRQLSRIVSQMADTVMVTDKHGIIEYVNPAFEQVTGYSSTEVIGKKPNILKSGKHGKDFYTNLWKTILHGDVFWGEMVNRRRNGDHYYETRTISPIRDTDGVITHFIATGKDVTEQHQMEMDIRAAQRALEELNRDLEQRVEERTEEVRRREALYRALFENSNDGIFLFKPNKELQAANQPALDMLGYSLEEYQELAYHTDIPSAVPEQKSDAVDKFAAVLRGEFVPLYERTFIKKDGGRIEVEINLSPVRDENGDIIMVQSVVRNITERKKSQEALRESRDKLSAANAALEKASRLKDDFLASMSHELRTPLTGILGLSEALQIQNYGQLNEKQLKAVKNIESSGRHLLELINDILDLSKIEAGKLDLQLDLCAVDEICKASLQLIKGMASQKNQSVRFSAAPQSTYIQADPRRLKQMLVNLLSNAIKFTPENGEIGLDVETRIAEKVIAFTVWDKGIGIKPEELNRLFKPFVQLDSRLARQHSGTGLGLSLVQRMAELHGGGIQVMSAPGQGSRFTILLPWDQQDARPAAGRGRQDTKPLRNSFVIEDNALHADRISRFLEEMGIVYVVESALSNALSKIAELQPSIILLDLNLPDGNGLDFLEQLKANPLTCQIPVIISSVEERQSEALRAGAAGYLVKPYTQEDLRLALEQAADLTNRTEPIMIIGHQEKMPLILMADDNELILETVGDFLSASGFRVVAARSGLELLDRVAEIHPDVLLIDVQMPGIDGMSAMRRLRNHSDPAIAATPIIAITALAMPGDQEKCMAAGANLYYSKPIMLAQLVQEIRNLLQTSKGKV